MFCLIAYCIFFLDYCEHLKYDDNNLERNGGLSVSNKCNNNNNNERISRALFPVKHAQLR